MAFPKKRPSVCSLLLVLGLLATACPAGAVSDPNKEDDTTSGRFDRTAHAPAPLPENSGPFRRSVVGSGLGAAVPSAPAPSPGGSGSKHDATPPARPNWKEEYPYVLRLVLAYAYDALRGGESLAFAIVLAMIGYAVYDLGEYPGGLVGGAGGVQA